nr:uncharacterized protein LOC111835832 isoform X1 [Paramormyrops kingsleyae]
MEGPTEEARRKQTAGPDRTRLEPQDPQAFTKSQPGRARGTVWRSGARTSRVSLSCLCRFFLLRLHQPPAAEPLLQCLHQGCEVLLLIGGQAEESLECQRQVHHHPLIAPGIVPCCLAHLKEIGLLELLPSIVWELDGCLDSPSIRMAHLPLLFFLSVMMMDQEGILEIQPSHQLCECHSLLLIKRTLIQCLTVSFCMIRMEISSAKHNFLG